MIRERIIEIFEFYSLNNKEIEEITNISSHKWGNLKTGKQRANEEHIEAVIKKWPEYSYWITTGETLPEAGQISPELEETRRNLSKAG